MSSSVAARRVVRIDRCERDSGTCDARVREPRKGEGGGKRQDVAPPWEGNRELNHRLHRLHRFEGRDAVFGL